MKDNPIIRIDLSKEEVDKAKKELEFYLLGHEEDIAIGINDFDVLRRYFMYHFRRAASE